MKIGQSDGDISVSRIYSGNATDSKNSFSRCEAGSDENSIPRKDSSVAEKTLDSDIDF